MRIWVWWITNQPWRFSRKLKSFAKHTAVKRVLTMALPFWGGCSKI